MKKTIISLLAVMATSVQAADITFDYTSYGKEDYTPTLTSPNIIGEATYVEATMTGVWPDKTTWTGTYRTAGQGGTLLTPAVNVGKIYSDTAHPEKVGNKGTWTYTLSFTATKAITINSIDLAIFSSSDAATSSTLANNVTGTQILTLTSGDNTQLYTNTQTVTYVGDSSASAHAVVNGIGTSSTWGISNGSGAISSFTPTQALTLNAGETYKLTLTTEAYTSANYNLGLAAIRLNAAVPEPATATLSLLALAGLAARRRRK